jgi:ProP effector
MKHTFIAVLEHLAGRFPQTFVLERHLPHRPLKIGINADLIACCPEFSRYELGKALGIYTGRILYLLGVVAGAPRVDLDGNPAGEVTTDAAEHAVARLTRIMASREIELTAAVAGRKRAAAGKASPAPNASAPTSSEAASPPAPSVKVLPLKERPMLRLPAFQRKAAR